MSQYNPSETEREMSKMSTIGDALAGSLNDSARDPKHKQLANSIGTIASIALRLQELSDRVSGSGQSVSSDAKDPCLPLNSLQGVLDHGPGQIKDDVSSAHQLIEKIESQLF